MEDQRPQPNPTTNGADGVDRRIADRLGDFVGDLDAEELVAFRVLLAQAYDELDLLALEATPVEDLFDSDEQALIAELDALPVPEPLILSPKPSLIMKATRLCNLRCTYCNAWAEGPDQQMTFEVLARTTHGVLRDPGVTAPTFVWHGGEPTMRGVEFFRRSLWLQLHWKRPEQKTFNQLQTNATRLTPEFIDLCKRLHIGISVSLDGPPEIHDRQRLDAAGRPTSARVREGIQMLRDAGLDPGVLMVIDEATVRLGAQRVLDYLLEIDVRTAGLLNAVPNIDETGVNADATWLPWGTWQHFLRDMYRLWWPNFTDRLYIRELGELIRAVNQGEAHKCHYVADCFSFAFTVEPKGEVGPCDKYVGDPDGFYGSVLEEPLGEILTSASVQARREADRAEVETMSDCHWHDVCSGGCPFDRAVNAVRGAGVPSGCCGMSPLLDDMAAISSGMSPHAVEATWGPLRLDEPAPSAAASAVPVSIGARR